MTHSLTSVALALVGRHRRVVGALLLVAAAPLCAAISPDAARFYEDGLRRFESGDLDGAIIQLKNSIERNKAQVAAHLLLAKALVRKGELAAAEAAFSQALSEGADRLEVIAPLARLYLELDRPSKAIEVTSVAGLPKAAQVEVLALRGAAFNVMGNDRGAAQAFQEARQLDPDSLLVTLEEMPFLLRSGQWARAKEAAAKALQKEPSNARVWTMNAVMLRDAGDAKGSLAAFDKAVELSDPQRIDARLGRAALLFDLGRGADARKDVDAAAAVAPKDLRVLGLQAALARAAGDIAGSRKSYTEMVAALDALPPAWLASRDKFAMMAAVAHHALGNRQQALSMLENVLARSPKHVEARTLQATLFLEMGDFARARPILEALGRSVGDDPTLLFQKGMAYLGTGRYAQALTALEAAAARMPAAPVKRALATAQVKAGLVDKGIAGLEQVFAPTKDAEAGRLLATIYLDRGQSKKAVAIAEAMATRWREDVRVLDFLGTVRGAAGDLKGARQAFMGVLAMQADLKVTQLNLAKLDVHERNFEAARQRLGTMAAAGSDLDAIHELGVLESRAGRPEEAVRYFQRAVELGSGDRRSALALIDQLVALRRTDEAMKIAKDMSLKFPDDLSLKLAVARTWLLLGKAEAARGELQSATVAADFDPEWQVRIGRLQLMAGNPGGATYNVQKALQGRPNDLQAMVLSVAVALAQNKVSEAEKAQAALTELFPQRPEVVLSGAHLALARGQFAQAVAGYKRALATQPSSENLLLLGRAHVMGGDPASAVIEYQNWLKKTSQDQPVLRAMAEAQMQSRQFAAARESYSAALNQEPNDGQLLNNLANVNLSMSDAKAAQNAAERALKTDPQHPAYMATLARALLQQGRNDAALPYLREARLRSPESLPVRWHLSVALAKLGRKDEARTELSALLQMAPNATKTPEVLTLKAELGL